MTNIQKRLKPLFDQWPLAIILLIGFLMRVTGLTFQSLWLDELHTMNEAGPDMSWGRMFDYLKCCDQHPPLHFFIERFAFSVFGHTEFVARFVSVLAGTVSIWAMYKLGKEVLNKQLGLIAAILTCVNFYNLSYSQEARPYIFAFLFAALSFTWFIRLIKSPSRKTAILYSLFTLLLLYSHYYSLFVVAAQVALAILFIFQDKGPERKKLFTGLALGGIIIFIGYAPWLSFLRAMTRIESFWIQDISPTFLQDFFYGYFGNADILKPFLLLLLLIYVANVSMNSSDITKVKGNPLLLSFIIILFWVFITLLIPYIRSLLTVPMLFPRYTIVILPAVLLALAYGIASFKNNLIKYSITGLLVVLSFIHILYVQKFYKKKSKSQFREMTQYIVQENTSNFPIINELTYWHQGYYLKKYGSKADIMPGKKENIIDSILSKGSAKYDLKGFWIAGAHGDKKPNDNTEKNLDTAYVLIKQKEFYDAWARLYVSKKGSGNDYSIISYDQFIGGSVLQDQQIVAVWTGSIQSKPLLLPRGKYQLTILAKGDHGGGQYPHLNIYIDKNKIGDYYLSGNIENMQFDFENTSTESITITIEMDNDFDKPGQGDRNAFIKQILINAR